MASEGRRPVLVAIALLLAGVAMAEAWRRGIWGVLTGAAFAALWLGALNWSATVRPRSPAASGTSPAPDGPAHRLLLDAAPTPMVAIEGEAAHALNRAARRLFATDDRLAAPPPGLGEADARHIRHEGRNWRVDRVLLGGDGTRMVVALIDIEAEERAAEARASADMIQVLGHELLNGLAPIASLAESGLAALDASGADPDLLREILGTLARRAEGLQRFTEAYRTLARLPEPALQPEPVGPMIDDLARLFAGRWPGVALRSEAEAGSWPLDRHQICQAVWALLQNGAEAALTTGAAAPWVALSAQVDGRVLAIAVADSGAGVRGDDAQRIFRPFHTTKAGGSGIGLSLARQIALAHGGALTLDAHAPTRFRMTLPAQG